MTEKELRQKVADTINAWVGATKGSTKHLDILAVYNGHTPLARGYKVKVKDAYCAATVSAAYIRAGIAEYIGTECGVEKYVQIAKGKGIWTENDAHVPKIGDACVYDWNDKGVGDCTGAGDHIGIVTDMAGGTFVVTEGNMSGGKVSKRTMAINSKYIRGFITPDFASIAKDMTPAGESGTATADTSYTVVAGDTLGKIAARYGTTVAELADINEIGDPNVIRKGQVIYLTAVAAATAKLGRLSVINSPDHWAGVAASGQVKYLDALLIRAAGVIVKAGTRTETPEEGVAAMVSAGIIDTPAYWLDNRNAVPSLDLLLCALGGAVK